MKITTITSLIFISVFTVASFFSPVQAKTARCTPSVGLNINLEGLIVARPHICWEGFLMKRKPYVCLCVPAPRKQRVPKVPVPVKRVVAGCRNHETHAIWQAVPLPD